MEKEKMYRTLRIPLNSDVVNFFRYCNRKGYIIGKKITEIITLYMSYITEKEKIEQEKEKKEFQKFMQNQKNF